MTSPSVDGVLLQWGERLFYPSNRRASPDSTPRLGGVRRLSAQTIRRRIQATVCHRAPQVMVKVTGGGRGMAAITAHFRYISKNGRLDIEDDRGAVHHGKEALHDLTDLWRHGGSCIDDIGHRREAFNVMLSMPRGTDPLALQKAARDFAHAELSGHRYVMVLHDHQANPHVHLSVRAESIDGVRLNPRKADLHRWRETFAEKLREHGVEAEATRQATRGAMRSPEPLWRVKAAQDGRLSRDHGTLVVSGERQEISRKEAMLAWARIAQALEQSGDPADQALAQDIARFAGQSAYGQAYVKRSQQQRDTRSVDRYKSARAPQTVAPARPAPDIER